MKRVFIVDDDKDHAELLALALRGPGRQVRAFAHPLDALTALATDPVDLLIADLSMPWVDGKGVILSARKRREQLTIFLVSGYDRGAEIAQETGARFFRKPIDLDKLRSSVDDALKSLDATA